MINPKKRVLWMSEASFLNTGFSTISEAILRRLSYTNKYVIGELGSYAASNDRRALNCNWQFYGGIPTQDNEYGKNRYNSSVYGQFGEAVYEQVLLTFKPDIIINIRDPWMQDWIWDKPFTEYAKHICMPTIDGEPQKQEWIDKYLLNDTLLTYSHYAKSLIENNTRDTRVFDVVSPGVDHNLFVKADKAKYREILGIPKDAMVIGTTMRNQKRKLFPDLFEAFAMSIEVAKSMQHPYADKAMLYCHTSSPDVGWDLATHLIRTGIQNRVLFTYVCESCKKFYASKFDGNFTFCRHCGEKSAHMPNTQLGVVHKDLAYIYSCLDLYVQMSISEGYGAPIAEAKSCSVPCFVVNYSAMPEHVKGIYGSDVIHVQRFINESVQETEQARALPDVKDAAFKMYRFFSELSDQDRVRAGEEARKSIEAEGNFDRAAKIFEAAIDNLEVRDVNETWLNKSPNMMPNVKINASHLPTTMFVDACCKHILGDPKWATNFWRHTMCNDIESGFSTKRTGRQKYGKEEFQLECHSIANHHNTWENERLRRLGVDLTKKKERFIKV